MDKNNSGLKRIKFEYSIIAAYLLAGGLWILFSDMVLHSFIKDPLKLQEIQTFKGWFYVLITAILFYAFLKRHLDKLREAEKRARQSDQLKTTFLQNISHEIRTPMNSIIGFSDLLKEKDITPDQRDTYIEIITQSSNQLLNIVNDVIDISIIETGNFTINRKPVNLNKMMEELFQIYTVLIHGNVKITMQNGLDNNSCNIITDETKLRQILNNLLNNAIKFTHQGSINFRYRLINSELEFCIEDTGIGISHDSLNKVFDRFSKLNTESDRFYEGVGLGLTICKGNLDLLNGRIWIESEKGKGSKFYFTIPYEPATL